MSDTNSTLPKPKKSVALSGTPAGNTALCTLWPQLATTCITAATTSTTWPPNRLEESPTCWCTCALPTQSQLAAYKTRLKRAAGLAAIVTDALERCRPTRIPMACCAPDARCWYGAAEREGHPASEARDIADRLIASFGSMLMYGGTSPATAPHRCGKPTTTRWPRFPQPAARR